MNNPVEFSKYKATEAFNAPNTMLYFMDIFGTKKVFDAHSLNGSKNYRHRIPTNYTQEYINSAIEGFGINMFDIYGKLFIKNGLNKTQPELFKKIQKYKEILLSTKELPLYRQKTPLIISGITLGVGILALVLKQIITSKKEATPKSRHFINKKI